MSSSLGGSNGKVPVVGDGSAWKNTRVIKQIQILIDFGVNYEADQDTKLGIYIEIEKIQNERMT